MSTYKINIAIAWSRSSSVAIISCYDMIEYIIAIISVDGEFGRKL